MSESERLIECHHSTVIHTHDRLLSRPRQHLLLLAYYPWLMSDYSNGVRPLGGRSRYRVHTQATETEGARAISKASEHKRESHSLTHPPAAAAAVNVCRLLMCGLIRAADVH